MAIFYTGELHVEPRCFTLLVGQMIVSAKQVSFDCYGRVVDGELYNYPGLVAVKHEAGYYKAQKIDMLEVETVQEIYILKAKCFSDGCDIDGLWHQTAKGYETEIYKFSGYLNPL